MPLTVKYSMSALDHSVHLLYIFAHFESRKRLVVEPNGPKVHLPRGKYLAYMGAF